MPPLDGASGVRISRCCAAHRRNLGSQHGEISLRRRRGRLDSQAVLDSISFTQRYLECGHALELTVRAPEGRLSRTSYGRCIWDRTRDTQAKLVQPCLRLQRMDLYGLPILTDGDEFDDSSDARWTYVGANDEVLASNSWVQNHDPAEVWLNVRTEWGRTVSTNLLDAGNNGLAIR